MAFSRERIALSSASKSPKRLNEGRIFSNSSDSSIIIPSHGFSPKVLR